MTDEMLFLVFALLLLVGVAGLFCGLYLGQRMRPPLCPKCKQKMVGDVYRRFNDEWNSRNRA